MKKLVSVLVILCMLSAMATYATMEVSNDDALDIECSVPAGVESNQVDEDDFGEENGLDIKEGTLEDQKEELPVTTILVLLRLLRHNGDRLETAHDEQ